MGRRRSRLPPGRTCRRCGRKRQHRALERTGRLAIHMVPARSARRHRTTPHRTAQPRPAEKLPRHEPRPARQLFGRHHGRTTQRPGRLRPHKGGLRNSRSLYRRNAHARRIRRIPHGTEGCHSRRRSKLHQPAQGRLLQVRRGKPVLPRPGRRDATHTLVGTTPQQHLRNRMGKGRRHGRLHLESNLYRKRHFLHTEHVNLPLHIMRHSARTRQ